MHPQYNSMLGLYMMLVPTLTAWDPAFSRLGQQQRQAKMGPFGRCTMSPHCSLSNSDDADNGELPQQRPVPTTLALGPLFLSQIIGEQYFVPVYLPLLMFTGATEGRIDGPPAAITLAASTFIYFIGTSLTDMNGGSNTLFAAVNLIFSLLLLAESMWTSSTSDLSRERLRRRIEAAKAGEMNESEQELMRPPPVPVKRGGDGLVRREDTALALVLTLALCAFLTTTSNPVGGLRG